MSYGTLIDMTQSKSCLASWTTDNCNANGIDIHYRRTGGACPPLVALHGLLGSGACLAPLARVLETGFDVVLPDARGHGKSSAPARGYLYGDLAGDVVELVKRLNLSAPILLGHSMGGMTAAVAARELGAGVSGVILIDPTFISPERQREVFESDIAEEQRRSLVSSRADLLDQARVRHPSRSAEILECLVDARLQTSMSAFEVLTPPNPDYRELVQGISVPMLLVIGDRGIVSLDTARELQKLNPLLRYELITDAGHGLPYDQPERLGTVIMPFLRLMSVFHAGAAFGK
ncbi:alpha/beta fold hydrolase [Rhizobium sp. NPDC090279]|uniref:alpha/beta fold hydrolase n=1 Tax=Rhizobium sp. NPDC090279 TaxID=3364499 RepID=UPI00383A0EB9